MVKHNFCLILFNKNSIFGQFFCQKLQEKAIKPRGGAAMFSFCQLIATYSTLQINKLDEYLEKGYDISL